MKNVLTAMSFVALLWGGVGCGSEEAAAYMADARAAHVEFERDAVPEVLERFLALPVPEDVNEDDARVVRHDMYYRLSEHALNADDAERAHEWATRGLDEGTSQDVFTANLYVVRGAAREALGRDIDAASDYHEALLINDALLQQLLEGDHE